LAQFSYNEGHEYPSNPASGEATATAHSVVESGRESVGNDAWRVCVGEFGAPMVPDVPGKGVVGPAASTDAKPLAQALSVGETKTGEVAATRPVGIRLYHGPMDAGERVQPSLLRSFFKTAGLPL